MPTILVVDDDRSLIDVYASALEDRFDIVPVGSGAVALQHIRSDPPDMVLLDLVLPDGDGSLLVPKIRALSSVPIIVLSGRQSQADRVLSLKMGADDFISKPFDLDDLDARIEAVLRRCAAQLPAPSSPGPNTVCGTLQLTRSHLAHINGRPFHVTPTEFHLLTALVAASPETVEHEALGLVVWPRDDPSFSHLVHVHIGRLRKRLASVAGAPTIHTAYDGCSRRTPRGYSIHP